MRRLLFFLVLMLTPSVCFAQANARMLAGVNTQTGTTYTMQAVDQLKLTTFNNSSPVAVTLPSPLTINFGATVIFSIRNLGAGAVTITTVGSLIDGVGTLVLQQGQGVDIYSDGNNYFSQRGAGTTLSGMTAAQVPIASSTTTITSSKPIQGVADPNILGSGTVSGTSIPLCTDANGGATTVGCPAGGGAPTAPNFQAQVYNNGSFAATPCFNVTAPTSNVLSFLGCDTANRGPNPNGVDIRVFGGAPYNPNIAPAASGITASCNGTTTLTLSAASTFVNGVGITVLGCGATNTLATPSAPSISSAMVRSSQTMGDVVTGVTGATTYNYKIAAQDLGMGITAASAAGTITTGIATLGNTTTNLTSCSRANATVTCITSSAHGLVVGAEIKIRSMSDQTFVGNWQVATVPDNTHFTYTGALDTRNGATTSATGGSVTYWPCNHVTWAAVTNAFRYLIYSDRGSPGTFKLIGISKPAYPGVLSTYDGNLYFDDFGAETSYGTPPWSVSSTAPASAVNDALTTTIVSGAGTTTLVLANAASQTLSNSPARVDNAPNIKNAGASVGGGQTVLIPATQPLGNAANFVTNSILDLSPIGAGGGAGIVLNVATANTWNDTLILGFRSGIIGVETMPGGQGTFAQGSYPEQFLFGTPGVWALSNVPAGGQGGNVTIRRLQLDGESNGQVTLELEGGGGSGGYPVEDIMVSTGQDAGVDDQSIGIFLRGNSGASGLMTSNNRITVIAAQGEHNCNTPSFYSNDTGNMKLGTLFFSGRGPLFSADPTSSTITIQHQYCQGCNTPLVMVAANKLSSSIQGFTLTVNILINDTGFSFPPMITGYNSLGTLALSVSAGGSFGTTIGYSGVLANGSLAGININGGTATGGGTVIGGVNPGGAIDGIFNTGITAGTYSNNASNGALSTGTNYPIFVNDSQIAAPSLSLNTGGSVPIGNHTYTVIPTWPNGGSGPTSAAATINVTTGNQTVVITWTKTVGCSGYIVLRDGFFITNANPTISGCFTPSYTDTASATFGGTPPTVSSGGPAMLEPGRKGVVAALMVFGGSDLLPPTGGYTAERVTTFPDSGGVIPVSGYLNSAYDNFNRANGAIGSNYNANSGTVNITSNVIGASAATISMASNNTIAPAPNQFSQISVTVPPTTSTNDLVGVSVRGAGVGVLTGYAYYCQGGVGRQIVKELAGSISVITSAVGSTTTPCFAGDILRLEANTSFAGGNVTLTAFYTPASTGITVQDSQGTDSTSIILSGTPGVFMSLGTQLASGDNWSGGNLHPIAQLDTEQDWVQPQHHKTITVGNTAPIPGSLGVGIYSSAWAPSSGICTDSTSRLTTTSCAGGSISGLTAGQVAIAGSASSITSSKPLQGTDTNVLTSSTVAAGTGNPLCTDTGSGATTTGCPNLSGMTSGQVAIAGSAITVTSSKALQGTDTSVLSSGTVSGTGATLCTDANGGATTVGCTGGSISGLTAGQIPVAGTATTITSSKPQQGTDANILTSGTISATTPALLCTDANSGATTSNCSVYNTQSATTNTNIAATNMVASAPANTMYMYMWIISLTTVGTGCTSTTSVVLNLIFTDPSAAGSVTESLGQISIAPGGNGTLGFVAQGNDTVYAKSATAVQYSTSGYTPGTGCTVNPSYQVTMRLIPIS